jgi:hypothetical protein
MGSIYHLIEKNYNQKLSSFLTQTIDPETHLSTLNVSTLIQTKLSRNNFRTVEDFINETPSDYLGPGSEVKLTVKELAQIIKLVVV